MTIFVQCLYKFILQLRKISKCITLQGIPDKGNISDLDVIVDVQSSGAWPLFTARVNSKITDSASTPKQGACHF